MTSYDCTMWHWAPNWGRIVLDHHLHSTILRYFSIQPFLHEVLIRERSFFESELFVLFACLLRSVVMSFHSIDVRVVDA